MSNKLINSKVKKYRTNIENIEKLINYQFKDKSLILKAITHPSAVRQLRHNLSYECLEFLGDSLLGSYVASYIYTNFTNYNEGKLTNIKTKLVSGKTLSKVAHELGFAEYIIFGVSETKTNNRGLESALENVYEAICGAIYLDGGLCLMQNFIFRTLIYQNIKNMSKIDNDSKSKLQMIMQENKTIPIYTIIDKKGPAHDRQFKCQLSVNGIELSCAWGKSKKLSEQNAARLALKSYKTKLKGLI